MDGELSRAMSMRHQRYGQSSACVVLRDRGCVMEHLGGM